jgi:hypothetical protein
MSHIKGDPRKKVLRLKKAIYGFVEAPRLWYETLSRRWRPKASREQLETPVYTNDGRATT